MLSGGNESLFINICMGKFRNAFIKLHQSWVKFQRRRKLKYKDFTIISNNCWAGTAVYQPFGLKYNTPTVGLFIMDEDYIRFLERLEWYLTQTPIFIAPQKSRYYDRISERGTKEISYPIAVLGNDVELHFLHFHSQSEALEKWTRRCRRINFDRLIVKMSLRDSGCDMKDMHAKFKSLPFKSKFCFSPIRDFADSKEIIFVPELRTLNLVGGDETECTLHHINILEILNSI